MEYYDYQERSFGAGEGREGRGWGKRGGREVGVTGEGGSDGGIDKVQKRTHGEQKYVQEQVGRWETKVDRRSAE